jgi:hypothetical protein
MGFALARRPLAAAANQRLAIRQMVLTVLLLASSLTALPPDPMSEPKIVINCNHIKKLVMLFGEARVVEEARNRKVSEQTIIRIRRDCFR